MVHGLPGGREKKRPRQRSRHGQVRGTKRVQDSGAVSLLDDYATYHRDARNRICHEIGIPLIVLAIFALLELVRLGPLDLGGLVAVVVLAYYFRISPRLAWVAAAAFVVLYAVGRVIPWWLAVALFIVGWIFQFVGHVFEGRKPAFLTNVAHLLVGPLWICGAVVPSKGPAHG